MFTFNLHILLIRNTLSIKALEKRNLETFFQERYLSEQAVQLLPSLSISCDDGHQYVEYTGIPLRSIEVVTNYLNPVAIVLEKIQKLYSIHIDHNRVEYFMAELLKEVSIPGYFINRTHLKRYLKRVLSSSVKLAREIKRA